ncbi:hypothetical protein B0J14DRAFT_577121 [Halenospora varia]|nr:hypothetical protein B0J14DRAFT_577121 [Halenospora varia]
MTDFKTSSTTIVNIPSQHPFRYMEKVFENFKNKCAAIDNLLVVYCHGHGSLENNKLMWAANRNQENGRSISPMLEWSAFQTGFESAALDVLILLDCCNSAASVRSSPIRDDGTIETIAVCGFDRVTSAGASSFSAMLVQVLRGSAVSSQRILR